MQTPKIKKSAMETPKPKSKNWGGYRPGAGRKPDPTVMLRIRVKKDSASRIYCAAVSEGKRMGAVVSGLAKALPEAWMPYNPEDPRCKGPTTGRQPNTEVDV